MPLYVDACALAKRYLQEGRSTQRMKEITGRSSRWGGLMVSSFVEIEVASAIAKAARQYGNPFGRREALRAVPRTVDEFQRAYRSGAFTIVAADDVAVDAGIAELRTHPEHEIGAVGAAGVRHCGSRPLRRREGAWPRRPQSGLRGCGAA